MSWASHARMASPCFTPMNGLLLAAVCPTVMLNSSLFCTKTIVGEGSVDTVDLSKLRRIALLFMCSSSPCFPPSLQHADVHIGSYAAAETPLQDVVLLSAM